MLGWRPAAGLEVPLRPGWVLQRQLGSGGFGEVWKARHRGLDTDRVFKFCFEPDQLRALKREVALFRLLHRSLGGRRDIARLLDWQVEERPYFLESEYHGDGNLRDWAESQGPLDEIDLDVRLEIVRQVSQALAAAHGVGVLHKDVKPSNVLVAMEGGRPRIWLADFGIGAITDPEPLEDSGVTEVGLTQFDECDGDGTVGTRHYMAPELSVGEAATIRSDVYSLGVLLYQMVVGDLDRVLGHGWERDIEDPELRADIAACVDVDPAQRLSDAGELSRRLGSRDERRKEREEEQRLLRERAEAEVRRHERRRRQERSAFWAAIALALISIAAGAFTWRQARAFRHIVERSTHTVLEQVLETNRSASYWVAQALNRELTASTLAAERLAADPAIRAALAEGRYADCAALLEARRRDMEILPMRGIALFDEVGTMRARAPAMPELYGRNYAYRDYFSAGDPEQRTIRETHISEPFVTSAADKAILFSVASPLWEGGLREGAPDRCGGAQPHPRPPRAVGARCAG